MSRNPFLKIMLLGLAVLPCAIVVVMAACLFFFSGKTEDFNWHTSIWTVVVFQIAAIGAFSAHASGNKRLTSDELGNWIFQFIVYIPFGMFRYWTKHVDGQR